ncbi:MAG: hypothetical protein AAFZ65_13035 [Planctomycetota bacterium]
MTPKTLLSIAIALSVGAAGVLATQLGGAERETLPELSAAPELEPLRLVEAQPFRLLEPAVDFMDPAEGTFVEGQLLVLEVEAELLVRRQSEEHVLYVGDRPVRRYNNGDRSGRVVVLAPGPVDLTDTPVFFGAAALPERLTVADRQQALAGAVAQGVRGFGTATVERASVAVTELPDGYELDRFASYLVERHSPLEVDVITGLRAERLGR